jgi:4-amino-4-deoxy-L-arabinose transferase-like glycosyltransferase
VQAQLFAEGRLSFESAPDPVREAFALDHVVDDGRVRSKYPPGWPALLAFGVLVGQPWLTNLLIGAATVVLIFLLVRDLAGNVAGMVAAGFLALSPFFFFNTASYFSHVAALGLSAASLWCVTRETNNKHTYVAAGLFWGLLFLVRQLDAVLLLVALAIGFRSFFISFRWVLFIVPGLLVAGLLFVYNAVQFGGPLTSGYTAYQPAFERLYGAEQSGPDLTFGHIMHWREHFSWLGQLIQWTSPAILLAPLVGLTTDRSDRERLVVRVLVALLAFTVGASLFLKSHQGDGYGPRYLFQTLLPLALLVGLGANALWDKIQRNQKVAWMLVGVSLIAGMALTAQEGWRVRAEVSKRSRLFQQVERAHLSNAVVLIRDADAYGTNWYTRNGIGYSGNVVFARDLDPITYRALRTEYPDRSFYLYRRGESGKNRLAPLSDY